MDKIIAFPDPKRRGRLRWMTLDEAEVHVAELAVQVAYGRMLLLKLQQFQQFFTQQKISRGEWQ